MVGIRHTFSFARSPIVPQLLRSRRIAVPPKRGRGLGERVYQFPESLDMVGVSMGLTDQDPDEPRVLDIATPTLVIHGELDYRVVITQGLVLYGALEAKGVPARLVYYSDEGHWIEKRSNALHWWGEFSGWLERWM